MTFYCICYLMAEKAKRLFMNAEMFFYNTSYATIACVASLSFIWTPGRGQVKVWVLSLRVIFDLLRISPQPTRTYVRKGLRPWAVAGWGVGRVSLPGGHMTTAEGVRERCIVMSDRRASNKVALKTTSHLQTHQCFKES